MKKLRFSKRKITEVTQRVGSSPGFELPALYPVSGAGKLSPQAKSGPLPVFRNKFYWHTAMSIGVPSVYGCLHAIAAELSSGARNHTVYNAWPFTEKMSRLLCVDALYSRYVPLATYNYLKTSSAFLRL